MKHPSLNAALRAPSSPFRRRLLSSAVAGMGALALPRLARAQNVKIRIGYWPIAAGLPFYAAIEKGYFKEAGLDVEPIKFAGAQQVMEAMLSGRADGSSNGTGSANLAIGEIASPGLLKIIVSNPSNVTHVLDEFLVAKDAPYKAISELKGKRVGSGPGIQNVTLCKTVLERSGVTDATVIELPIGQHVASIAANQIDAVYTLEPTGTVGRLNGVTRILEAGVSLTSEFIKANPDVTRKYIAAYARGVELVRSKPAEARPYLKGYTAIEGPLTGEVPLAAYTLHNEFTKYDIEMFQKFFDLFADKKIFEKRVLVDPMIYKG